jgi:hypothetical protein
VHNERDIFLVWLDVTMLLFGGFVIMSTLLLALVNDPAPPKPDQAAADDGIYFRIKWKESSDIDVDLWSRAPGDVPVGYSSKQGRFIALKEDNLGKGDFLGGDRREESHAFAMPPGEYCATAGLYRTAELVDEQHPLTVFYQALFHFGGVDTDIAHGSITLTRVGEEKTLACFSIDDRKLLVLGSLNTLDRHIWRAP